MSKKLCVTAFVFGKYHQCYIPLFLFSIKKAYPDCYPIVYIQGELDKNINSQIEEISPLGDFKIVDHFYDDFNFNSQRGKSIRWIVWDKTFLEYDALYYADIDMFYIRENPSLYDQHLSHCKLINKPISNVVRVSSEVNPFSVVNFLRIAKNNSIKYAFNRLFKGVRSEFRLSGLHFVQTKPYFEKVSVLLDKYKGYIFGGKTFDHHLLGFYNESLLYDLVVECGWGEGLPVSSSNTEMMDTSKFNRSFRPHHGIHLGIFRDEIYPVDQVEILELDVYKKYYEKFQELKNDVIYKKIEKNFNSNIKKQIDRLDKYYQ